MFGATLSRWTLSYFAASLIFLIAGEALMLSGFGYPFHGIQSPETLIVVHIIAIGWLGFIMCGALLQFVPVLVARPLWGAEASLPVFLLLLAGLFGLLLGFAGLTGLADVPLWAMPASGMLLFAGFLTIIVILAVTIAKAGPVSLPARFVAVGLGCLVVTVLLGVTFTFVLSGVTDSMAALELTGGAIPLHALLGLGGWMSFTAMGVSYRLLTMFLLSPDVEHRSTRIVWWSGAVALALIAAGVFIVAAGQGGLNTMLLAAALLGIVAFGLYVRDIQRIYRQRKRKTIELNSAASIHAFAAILLSAALVIALPLSDYSERVVGALAYLFSFGWLTGLSLAQLYKIVPFMTWLECYGPVMGKTPTPRVQDIVVEDNARFWFHLFYIGVALATLALLAGYLLLFRLGSALNLVATLALITQFVRARRLLDVPVALRLPQGVTTPHLLFTGASAPRRSK